MVQVDLQKMHRQLKIACLLLGLLVPLQAGVARAEPPASLSVGVERLPADNQAIVRLTAAAGGHGAAFGIQYRLPSWPGGFKLGPASEGDVLGSPIRVRYVRLEGPGRLSSAPGPGLKPRLRLYVCARNYRLIEPNRYWLEVPAGSTTRVEMLVEGSFPAWPGTDYTLSLSTFATNEPGADLQPLRIVDMGPLSPKGTLIRMRRAAGSGDQGGRKSPEIIGTTQPPFRQARISLQAIRVSSSRRLSLHGWSSPDSVRLGSVWTDQQGHFRLSPMALPWAGWYGVLARSEARDARAADWNCGPFFRVDS